MSRLAVLVCISIIAIGALAQTVDFRNDVPFAIEADRKVYFMDGSPVVGNNFRAQLYYGASADSLTPVTSAPAPFRAIPASDPLAGTWIGGTRTLTGFFPGAQVTLQVRVWDGTVARSYEQAALINFLGTQHGISQTFTYIVPPVGGDPFSYMENFRGFILVPEPSLIGLALLGAGALFPLMRRK